MTAATREMFEIFQEAVNLLPDEDSWCKHVLCRPVHRDITESSQRCLLGAVWTARRNLEASSEDYNKTIRYLSDGLPTEEYEKDGGFSALSRLNDKASFHELSMWMREKLHLMETDVTHSLA